MKKIITILTLLPLFARAQTIPSGAQPWAGAVVMEYWSGLIGANGILYMEQNDGAVGTYPTAFPLPGSRLVKSAAGGFNRMYVTATDGTVWMSSDYNAGRNWTQIATDSAGNAINNAVQIFACTNTFIYQRSSDSAWLMGGTDTLGMFYSLTGHPGNFLMRALPITTPTKIKKFCMTTFGLVGIGYNNDTTYGWITYYPSFGTSPNLKLVPTGSTGHLLDIGYTGFNVYNEMILTIVSTSAPDTVGNLYAYGGGSAQWGGTSSLGSLTNISSIWSAGPWKSINLSSNATHAINYRGRIYGTGSQVQGEVGNGVEFVNRYTYLNWPHYNWDFQQGENMLSGVAPIDTSVGFKWIASNIFFAFYKLADDSAGNIYGFGRNKSIVQWDGLYSGIVYNPSDPNLLDRSSPQIVVPASGTWAPLKQYGTVTYPSRSAGSNQSITTSSATISNAGSPLKLVNSNSPFDTLCCSYLTFNWAKESGPSGDVVVSPTSASTNVNFTQSGVYRYRVTTTDNNNGMDTASVQVTVALSGTPPTVTASASPSSITLPVSSANLSGTVIYNSGSTGVGNVWTNTVKPSGATSPTITPGGTSTAPTASISGLATAGTYTFQLSATDSNGNTSLTTVSVVVNSAISPACPCATSPIPIIFHP